MFSAEKPGPPQTIAKELLERKLKPQKSLEKCVFFGGRVEIAAKNAGLQAEVGLRTGLRSVRTDLSSV
jgi:hypothetical protein